MDSRTSRALLILGVTWWALAAAPAVAQSTSVDLDFNQDGVLPSSQGFSYVGPGVDTDIFSVAGGLLHMDSHPAAGYAAWYQVSGAYDHSLDFVLEFRMKVIESLCRHCVDLEVSDTQFDYEFGFATDGISLPPSDSTGTRPFFTFNTTDGFHAYKIFSAGGSNTYDLYIDGELALSGTIAPGGDPGAFVAFGDGGGAGIAVADFDYVRYAQSMTVSIDIKPGEYPNPVNLSSSSGVLPVAILSSSTFNASTVDPSTVTLASAPVKAKNNGTLMSSLQDVNGDGLVDLLLHFSVQALSLSEGSLATLEGNTSSGLGIHGSDTIRVVP